MANKDVIKVLRILVEEKGLKAVTRGLESLNNESGKTSKSANKLKRNLEGVAKGGLSSGKAFARTAQGMGGLVQAYATVAANVFALSSAFLVLQRNADLQIMQKAAEDLSNSIGINFGRVAMAMKDVTKGALSMSEAMQSANLGIVSGLTASQVGELSEVAAKAAQATGRDAGSSVQRLIQAVAKGEPELADELGIIIRVQKAVDDYAAAHNKAATELTTFERQQAIANQAIERGNKAFKDVEIRENPYTQLLASVKDLGVEIIALISGPIASFATFLKDNLGILLVAIFALSKSIAKRALPDLLQFGAEWQKEVNKMTVAATESANRQIKAVNDIKNSYGFLLRSRKSVAKELRKFPIDALDPRTAAARALNRGAGNDDLLKAFATTFKSRKYVGAIEGLMDDLDDVTKKRISFLGKTISRETGRAIIASLLKLDSGLNKGIRQAIDNRKDIITGGYKGLVAATKATVAQVGAYWQSARAGLFGGIAAGFNTEFGKINVTAKATAQQVYGQLIAKNELFNRSLAKTLAYFTAIGVRVGGVASAVGGFALKMVNVVAIVTVVVTLFKQMLEWIGLTNAKSRELLEINKEMLTTSEKMEKRLAKINKYNLDVLGSATDITRKFTALADITSEIAENIDKLREANREFKNIGFFDKLFNFDFSDNRAENAAKQVANAAKAAGKEFRVQIGGSVIDSTMSLQKMQDVINKAPDKESFIDKLLGKLANFNQENATAIRNFQKLSANVEQFIETDTQRRTDSITEALGSSSVSRQLASLISLSKDFKTVREDIAGGGLTSNEQIQKERQVVATYNKLIQGLGEATAKAYGLTEIKKFADVQGQTANLQRVINTLNEQHTAEITNQTKIEENAIRLRNQRVKVQQQENGAAKALRLVEREALDLQQKKVQIQINAQNRLLAESKGSLSEVERAGISERINQLEAKKKSILNEENEILNDIKANIQDITAKNVENLQNAELELEVYKQSAAEAKILYDQGRITRYTQSVQQQLAYTKEIELLDAELLVIESKLLAAAASKVDKLDLQKEKQENLIKQSEILAKVEQENKKLNDDVLKNITKRTELESNHYKIISKSDTLYDNATRENAKLLEITKERELYLLRLAEIENSNLDPIVKAAQKEQERLKYLEAQLQLERERINLALKNSSFSSGKGQKAIGDKFAMMADDFSKKIKSSAELFVDTVTAGMDGAIDAFGDALLNGFEGGLKETFKNMGKAIVDGMNEVIVDQVKNQLKTLGRGILAEVFKGTPFGKSLQGSGDPVLDEARTHTGLLTQIANNTSTTGLASGGKCSCMPSGFEENLPDIQGAAEGVKDETTFIGKILGKGRDMFTFSFDAIKTILQKGANAIGNALATLSAALSSGSGGGGIFSTILDSIVGGIVGSVGGGIGLTSTGAGNTFSTSDGMLIDLNFNAKGGIMSKFGQMPLNTYSSGGIATSPQAAIFGEGSMPEAYVPLPDGRSIPVTITNGQGMGGGTVNQVNVTVNYEEGGASTQSSDGGGAQGAEGVREFSNLIAAKVREELINQSRPGGLLSR